MSMSKTILAVYENGVFKPTAPVDIPDHSSVEMDVRSIDPAPQINPNLSRFAGILKSLPVDPLDFQKQIREEWD